MIISALRTDLPLVIVPLVIIIADVERCTVRTRTTVRKVERGQRMNTQGYRRNADSVRTTAEGGRGLAGGSVSPLNNSSRLGSRLRLTAHITALEAVISFHLASP